MKYYNLGFVFLLFTLFSCVVKAPRYTTVEKVLTLKLGLTRAEVSQILGTVPYNFILMTDTADVLLYKYRVTDRAIAPFLIKPNNGKSVLGKYVNLLVTYDKTGLSTKMESCNDCDVTMIERKKLDANKLVTLLTVILPIVLVFVGINFTLK